MAKLEPQYKEFFKTLGNETRINILLLLKEQGPLNVATITRKLGIEQSAVSHNLRRLATCRFVTVKQKGKERLYSLNEQTIKPLFALISEHAETYCKKLCC